MLSRHYRIITHAYNNCFSMIKQYPHSYKISLSEILLNCHKQIHLHFHFLFWHQISVHQTHTEMVWAILHPWIKSFLHWLLLLHSRAHRHNPLFQELQQHPYPNLQIEQTNMYIYNVICSFPRFYHQIQIPLSRCIFKRFSWVCMEQVNTYAHGYYTEPTVLATALHLMK